MREDDAVALFGIAISFLLYVGIALGYLPTLFGGPDRLPLALQKARTPTNWASSTRRRNARFGYIGWSALTQFVPVVFLLAFLTGVYRSNAILGGAGAFEIAAAAVWTGYLLYLLRAASRN